MSTMTPTQPIASPLVADAYRMNIDEFERIAGTLDVRRVELIAGILVERGDMDPPHAVASVRLRFYLDRLVPGGWFVREDKPLRVHRTYEPFPDLAVVRGNPLTAYLNRHPGPGDVAIVTEISDRPGRRPGGETCQLCLGGHCRSLDRQPH